MPEKSSSIFDAYYYSQGCGSPYGRSPEFLAFFDLVAERIVSDIRPKTVLDAGCAMGFLVESLRKRGVEAYGIDISEHAIRQVHPDFQTFCRVGSLCDPPAQAYDLIVCIEVLEHMPKADAEKAITHFCRFSDDLLFSSTPYDYKEITHFNVQPPEVWAELFGRQGFIRDTRYDASFLTAWAVRFRRHKEPLHVIVREYEQSFALLKKENSDLRSLLLDMRHRAMMNERQIQQLNDRLAEQDQGAVLSAQKELQWKELQNRLDEVEKSTAWKLARSAMNFRIKAFPPGSYRDRLFQAIRRKVLP
jgi:hypothetical protein